ncbi:protein SCAR2 [Ricinus communis]|uniref:Protein SCAR n=1 Tax=Ricinus communis TaxID=3988 RepID=B9SL38_RICCO|nr:protein SCAR2 [Ricinus communis]EEF35729.1 Protein SCAR2, putative [Ricinus communis]|eukprot:XP_002526707.1 protein SCAR2 [Ricinus communis]
MPLARYEIRNEYGLADPELYKAADKDDPEALLEGVAMAGLVGVLRQLGDLAQFAAEVFHDLHEEVMATAARGHGLIARVQQLEAEVPSIEKAFLSQTDQSPFFTNAGVDWHPNLRMEENLITRGDLPRFVMDSYEECRGPPRLFLLDKFDVAGAGACLKRYTDPSLFKVEAASSGIEVQREKKTRKVKKKGSRWRMGDTPEVVPTSHAKLHQLFLEERVENGHSDPARIVKLKRRQLNGSPFDLKPGKSYMEKFLGTPSPEHKVVCEVSVNQSPLRLTLDNSSESGLEILEIGTVSPPRNSSQGRQSTGSSPIAQDVVLKSYTLELDEEAITRETMKVPDPISGGEDDASPYIIHKVAIEDELAIDGDRKSEESLDGDHSDELMSEVDNYMDALTTVESEMETDNEYKSKDYQGLLKVGKHGTDSDANEEHLDIRANFSDSQSFGNSSTSDDGKGSFKKGRPSFSYSDSHSNVAENIQSDIEGAVEVFPSSENYAAEIADSPLDQPSLCAENIGIQSSELIVYNNNTYNEEETIPNTGEASCNSCLSDSNSLPPPSAPVANSIVVSSAKTVLDEPDYECVKLGLESLNTNQKATYLSDSSIILSDPSQEIRNRSPADSSEGCPMEGMDHEDSNVFLCASNISDLEKEGHDGCANDVLQTDYPDGSYNKILVEEKIDSPHSVISPSNQQFPSSVFPEVDVDTGVTELSESLDVIKPVEMNSEIDDVTAATGGNSEIVTGVVEPPEVDSIKEQKCSDIAVDGSEGENDLTDIDSKVDVVGGDSVPLEDQNNYSDKLGSDDFVNLDKDVVVSPVAVATAAKDDISDDNCLAPDLICSSSSNLVDIDESLSGNQDPHLKVLDFNEVVLRECCTESEKQKEVKKLDVASTDVNSSPYNSVSDCQSNLDELENVHASVFSDHFHNRNSSYIADVTTIPSSELNNQELKSKDAHLRHSTDSSENAVSLPTCYLPEAGTVSAQHLVALQADQIPALSASKVMDEANSEPFVLQHSTPSHLEETGIPSEQSLDVQSDQPDAGCLQVHKASPKSSIMLSEQIETVSDMDQERYFGASSDQEALPSQGLLMQSAGQEDNGTVLSKNPFESAFPSFGPLPVNLEQLPPLPPLPPMQWRLGKFQPAPLVSQGEWTDHYPDTLLPTRPFTADENSKADSVLLGREGMQSSNPFFSFTSADIQKLEHSPTNSVESSVQPTSFSLDMPTVATDANSQQGNLQLEGTRSLNSYLGLPEISGKVPDDGFLASRRNPVEPSPDPLSSAVTVEHAQTENDPEPSHGLQIRYSNQVTPESVSELKVPVNNLQSSEGEERKFSDKSASPQTVLEDQYQQDLLSLHVETTWSASSLALPPTYEVGKPNGSKLPRPRNPLIDAVAAHDKSKLRKVTERVHPQVGPKIDERDSLLEQIRTKSFNLKPTAVTRHSIQGIQGPKTNLKVAAILEKANAIRQALTGSDEDDDSDSWSDS